MIETVGDPIGCQGRNKPETVIDVLIVTPIKGEADIDDENPRGPGVNLGGNSKSVVEFSHQYEINISAIQVEPLHRAKRVWEDVPHQSLKPLD